MNCISCSLPPPSEFVAGKLEPEHADLISQHWFPDYPEKLRIEFLRENIRNYPTFAVFKAGCSYQDRTPVSWIMRKAGGMVGLVHTLEEYRGRGLGLITCNNVAFKQEGFTEVDNSIQTKLYKFKHISLRSKGLWNLI